jgi:hypothetical protein
MALSKCTLNNFFWCSGLFKSSLLQLLALEEQSIHIVMTFTSIPHQFPKRFLKCRQTNPQHCQVAHHKFSFQQFHEMQAIRMQTLYTLQSMPFITTYHPNLSRHYCSLWWNTPPHQCFFWVGETYTQGQCMTVNFGGNVTYSPQLYASLTHKKHCLQWTPHHTHCTCEGPTSDIKHIALFLP